MVPARSPTKLEVMNAHILESAVIAIVVIAFVLYRQTRERPVRDGALRAPLILGIVGVVRTYSFLQHAPTVRIGEIAAVLLGFVIAVLLAFPRARSIQMYRTDSGTLVRRGGAITVGLWFAAIAAHVGVSMVIPMVFGEGLSNPVSGLEGPTLLIYLGISLGVQALIVQSRAQHDHRAPGETRPHTLV